MNRQELLTKLNLSSFDLRGADGINFVQVLIDYSKLKNSQQLAEQSTNKDILNFVAKKPELLEIIKTYKELELEIQKNTDANQKEELNNKKAELEVAIKNTIGGDVEDLTNLIENIDFYDKKYQEFKTDIRKEIAELTKEIYRLLPDAIRVDPNLINNLSLLDFNFLINEIVIDNKLNVPNSYDFFLR